MSAARKDVIIWKDLSDAERAFLLATRVLGCAADKVFIAGGVCQIGALFTSRGYNPMANINEIKDIIDLLHGHGFGIRLFKLSDSWQCFFWKELTRHIPSNGQTMEEAICLAALRARGLEIDA